MHMLCPRNHESQKINSNGEASFISHVLLRKLRFTAVQSLDGQVEAISQHNAVRSFKLPEDGPAVACLLAK